MCRDLKAKQALAKVLKRVQESTVEDYNGIGDEDDFRGLLDPPDIIGNTHGFFHLSLDLRFSMNRCL